MLNVDISPGITGINKSKIYNYNIYFSLKRCNDANKSIDLIKIR